ncbi:MAG: hypothetical protein ACLU5I_05525 [Alistipes finegoldii]
MAVSEVKAIDPTYEIGDEYADEIKLVVRPPRRVVAAPEPRLAHSRSGEGQPLREVFGKGRRNRHRRSLSGMEKEVLILDDEENELILPKAEQIPNDFYRKGDTIKAIVKSVEMNNNQPRIILFRARPTSSRTPVRAGGSRNLDGLITIKKIVRIPGERASGP